VTGLSGNRSLHDTLRAKGYRITPQRQLVLDAVVALQHGTPDEICAEVQRTASGVNLSTVYRTLELLEELGLVNHTHLSHGSPTYHPAGEDQHVHLVCRNCGSISEVDPSVMLPVTDRLRDEKGFRVDVGHVSLFGECGDCKDQS
jgi:Fur family ferric uptake transcriptional regulator